MVLMEDRHIKHWNRTENTEMDPHKYIQMIFDKSTKQFNWGKIPISVNGAKHWTSIGKKNEHLSKSQISYKN